MSRLTSAQRRALPLSSFGVPSKAPGPGSYPEPDSKHAALAEGFAKRFASAGQQKQINAKAASVLGKKKKVRPKAKRQVRPMGGPMMGGGY